MSRLPRISEAEWDVMSVLWAHEHAFAQEVASELAPRKDWNQRTVKTSGCRRASCCSTVR